MGQNPTFFSIVIPTYRRPAQLAECLGAVAKLTYPRDRFEVIVVDDGTEPPPQSIIDAFKECLDITLLTQTHGGPAKARNAAAAHAKGQYLAFIDDDCTPARDWLSNLASKLNAAPDRIVGGQTLNALSTNPYSAASQFILDITYDYYNADAVGARFFATNNMAVPLRTFKIIGGFDDSFWTSEDRDLCARWLNAGHGMTYVPEAVMYHAHHLTLRTFCRQHVNYGRGAFRFHRKRKQRMERSSVFDFGYYVHALRSLFFANPENVISLFVLCCVWQLANAVGFFAEWLKPAEI